MDRQGLQGHPRTQKIHQSDRDQEYDYPKQGGPENRSGMKRLVTNNNACPKICVGILGFEKTESQIDQDQWSFPPSKFMKQPDWQYQWALRCTQEQ